MAPTNLEMRVFAVTTGHPESPSPDKRICAAYYKTEDGFTTFKDADNQAVFTVRDAFLISVERVPSQNAETSGTIGS